METRRDTNMVTNDSIMPDLRERSCFGLPELQRDIPTNYILQNSIKHNTEPNQTILKGNNRRISVEFYAREIYS